jgi:hypothetical protein
MMVASALWARCAIAAPNWQAVDSAFGFAGKVQPGDVHRYGWPRSDLHVKLHGVELAPGLALGSWAGLVAAGTGDQVMAMGDLVLLDGEVGPVVSALQAEGIEITAIHNHLLDESPHVMYLHYMAHGDAATVARGLASALAKTKTPRPSTTKTEPTAAEQASFKALQEALGRTGTMAGHILQVASPRAEKIEEGGMEIPPGGMSLANPMNFQVVGKDVATTGDFVLIASEVNPVIAELRGHGVEVTALHSHMLTETPRLFFLHFWGLDTPEKIGAALKAALAKVNTKPAQ